jgi:hypothetical protein
MEQPKWIGEAISISEIFRVFALNFRVHGLTLPSDHALAMQHFEVRTFRQILERNHQLACFCSGCRRSATCNLAELVANGLCDRDPEPCRP